MAVCLVFFAARCFPSTILGVDSTMQQATPPSPDATHASFGSLVFSYHFASSIDRNDAASTVFPTMALSYGDSNIASL